MLLLWFLCLCFPLVTALVCPHTDQIVQYRQADHFHDLDCNFTRVDEYASQYPLASDFTKGTVCFMNESNKYEFGYHRAAQLYQPWDGYTVPLNSTESGETPSCLLKAVDGKVKNPLTLEECHEVGLDEEMLGSSNCRQDASPSALDSLVKLYRRCAALCEHHIKNPVEGQTCKTFGLYQVSYSSAMERWEDRFQCRIFACDSFSHMRLSPIPWRGTGQVFYRVDTCANATAAPTASPTPLLPGAPTSAPSLAPGHCYLADRTHYNVSGCTFQSLADTFTSRSQATFDTKMVCLSGKYTVSRFCESDSRKLHYTWNGVDNPMGLRFPSCQLVAVDTKSDWFDQSGECTDYDADDVPILLQGRCPIEEGLTIPEAYQRSFDHCAAKCAHYNRNPVNGHTCQSFTLHAMTHDENGHEFGLRWRCMVYSCARGDQNSAYTPTMGWGQAIYSFNTVSC